MGHFKRSYGPSESSAKNHPHRTPLSIVGVWFFKTPDGGFGRQAPSGGDYLDKFEAHYCFIMILHYIYTPFLYVCMYPYIYTFTYIFMYIYVYIYV